MNLKQSYLVDMLNLDKKSERFESSLETYLRNVKSWRFRFYQKD